MNLKIGTLLIDENGNQRVATEVQNGYPSKTESIETFVSRMCIVTYNGSRCTLQDVMELATAEFMSETNILHLSSSVTGGN